MHLYILVYTNTQGHIHVDLTKQNTIYSIRRSKLLIKMGAVKEKIELLRFQSCHLGHEALHFIVPVVRRC